MKKIAGILMLLMGAMLTQAQRTIINDPYVAGRQVANFHGVEVSGGIDLFLSQSNEEALAVSASNAEIRDNIISEVKDGVLKIYFRNTGSMWKHGNRKLRAYVAFKDLDKLKASGASDVVITGEWNAEEVDIELSGASDIKGKIVANKINIHQSGASDASLSGKVNELVVNASGASDMDAYELVSENCTVKASGASDVRITVNGELKADTSGASSVRHRGKASAKEAKITGRREI